MKSHEDEAVWDQDPWDRGRVWGLVGAWPCSKKSVGDRTGPAVGPRPGPGGAIKKKTADPSQSPATAEA